MMTKRSVAFKTQTCCYPMIGLCVRFCFQCTSSDQNYSRFHLSSSVFISYGKHFYSNTASTPAIYMFTA